MSNQTNRHACEDRCTAAAIMVLVVLTSVMLLAMFTRTEPHPPLEVAPFALAPFLAASLAIGVAAYVLVASGARFAAATAVLFGAERAQGVWRDYSVPWQLWNALRAVAAGIVLLLAGLGVLRLGKLAKSCYLPEDEPLCS